MTQAPILFEDFQPGALMGECVEVYDAEQAQRWQAIFSGSAQPSSSAAEGSSMAVVGMMRAYLKVVTPRPPGNVHARQKLRMYGVPQLGESIRVSVRCSHKEMRRERRYVDLQVQGVGEGDRPLFEGLISLIWAA
jgi:acyl dehydratase